MLNDLQSYLDSVARDAPAQYRGLLEGIAEFYRENERLTIKQMRPVIIAAQKQGKPPHPALREEDIAILDAQRTTAPAPNKTAIMADLFRDLAVIFNNASQRLR